MLEALKKQQSSNRSIEYLFQTRGESTTKDTLNITDRSDQACTFFSLNTISNAFRFCSRPEILNEWSAQRQYSDYRAT